MPTGKEVPSMAGIFARRITEFIRERILRFFLPSHIRTEPTPSATGEECPRDRLDGYTNCMNRRMW